MFFLAVWQLKKQTRNLKLSALAGHQLLMLSKMVIPYNEIFFLGQ